LTQDEDAGNAGAAIRRHGSRVISSPASARKGSGAGLSTAALSEPLHCAIESTSKTRERKPPRRCIDRCRGTAPLRKGCCLAVRIGAPEVPNSVAAQAVPAFPIEYFSHLQRPRRECSGPVRGGHLIIGSFMCAIGVDRSMYGC
jgi:hypothetical protein